MCLPAPLPVASRDHGVVFHVPLSGLQRFCGISLFQVGYLVCDFLLVRVRVRVRAVVAGAVADADACADADADADDVCWLMVAGVVLVSLFCFWH